MHKKASEAEGHEHAAFQAIKALQGASLTTTWVTPIDVARHASLLRELSVSRQSTRYPLSFTYRPPNIQRITVLAEAAVTAARRLMPELREALLSEVAFITDQAAAIASRDDIRFTAWQDANFGRPTEEHISAAWHVLNARRVTSDDAALIDSSRIAEVIRATLQANGCAEWIVEIKPDMASRMSVNGSLRRVRVRANQAVTPGELDRLVVHEVGGHVFRWMNASTQPFKFAAVPFGKTIPTEEGLAVLLEDEMKVSSHEQLRIYAARLVAVDLSRNHSLIGLARALAPFMGVSEACEISLRAKRGLTDPNSPGGSAKDAGYLAGFLRLKSLRGADANAVQLLRCTKWPLEMLTWAQSLAMEGAIGRPTLTPDPDRLIPSRSFA